VGGGLEEQPDLDPVTGLLIGRLVEPPLTAEWPVARTMPGHAVRLEPLDPDVHGDALWKAAGGIQNAALWQYMPGGPFLERQDFDKAIGDSAKNAEMVFFAIIDQVTGQAAGECAFLNIKPNHRSVEVGHLMFSPQLQRTRGATEALYLMARYAFDQLHYRRYEWKCNALNAKSRQAAERFGFRFEGVFRQHMIVKGRSRDSAWFSIVAEEWPAVRRALEAWLAPENFDEHGKQRRRLQEFA
jgi:RimJ/RimL family protein N-acetyltransferase